MGDATPPRLADHDSLRGRAMPYFRSPGRIRILSGDQAEVPFPKRLYCTSTRAKTYSNAAPFEVFRRLYSRLASILVRFQAPHDQIFDGPAGYGFSIIESALSAGLSGFPMAVICSWPIDEPLQTSSARGWTCASSAPLADDMGKARKGKSHGRAARAAADSGTAVSVEESIPLSKAATASPHDSSVGMKGGLLDGLTSLNVVTRESSCAAIASLFEKIDGPDACSDSWSAARRLIASGLVKRLLPRMLDRAPGVKLQAVGAMRNISAVRDPRVCEILVNDDCLTPVLTLLERMSAAPPATKAESEASVPANDSSSTSTAAIAAEAMPNGVPAAATQSEQESLVMAQLVATLCNLLASVDVAVTRFTRQGGLKVLLRLLDADGCRGNAEVFAGALQALHIATDSNGDLGGQVAALPATMNALVALVQRADLPHLRTTVAMRIQAAGVLVNVAGSVGDATRNADTEAELSRVVLPLLLEQMKYDCGALRQACVALVASNNSASASEGMDVEGKDGAGVDSRSTDGRGEGIDGADDSSRDKSGQADGGGEKQSEQTAVARVAAAVASSTPMDVTMAEADSSVSAPIPPGSDGDQLRTEAEVGARSRRETAAGSQPDMDAQIRWEWKLGVAEPLKLTAEVLTNLCSLAAAEVDEDDEKEWGSDDEDAMEQAAKADLQQNARNTSGAPLVLLDAITDAGALQRTLEALGALLSPSPRDQPQTKETVSAMEPVQQTASQDRLALPSGTAGDLADLRATVALCAANLVQNLPPRSLGPDPHAVWLGLCDMCEAAVERAPSCVETLTGVMWGLIQQAGPAIAVGIAATSKSSASDPLHLLLRLSDPEKTRAFETRVNAVGILGTLGAELAPRDGKVQSIGRALVQAIEDPHVLVQAEALNAVMDIYGDDGRDAAFRELGMPAALAAGVPAFRRKVKQEGKALGRDALCHLKETALNASRFVKYKQAMERAATR